MSHSDGQADEALVARLLAGDENAFVALVGRYQRPLQRVARTFVKDDSLAEDVVQETWIGLLRGIHKFEGRASFKTWLFRVLANRARTRAVRETRYIPIDQTDEPSTVDGQFEPDGRWRVPPEEWRITPERLLLSDEVRHLVETTLAGLPSTQRAVVELRDVEGLDAAEICNILGISETNQRVLLHRGRTRLRAALAARLSERAGRE
jgi:RNA polymerase sigma-70 factor (ECF subfamily)